MKAAYNGFESRRSGGFTTLPPVGAYVGEIRDVAVEPDYDKTRDVLVLTLEITEGEYANRFTEVQKEQQERFGGDVKYRGLLRIKVPAENDPEDKAWIRNVFEGAIWCVEQSNNGYAWDWDENKLKGKKVGFSVRETIYTGNDGSEKHSTEIGRLETVNDVKEGKVRKMNARDSRKNKGSGSAEQMTNVTSTVDVPF